MAEFDPGDAPQMDVLEGGDLEVLEGRDGWLFLAAMGATNVAELYSKPDSIDAAIFRAWADTLRKRREYFAERGITYVTLVVPDTHIVYSDKLPDGLQVSSLFRRLEPFLDPDTRAQVVYPVQELIDGRQQEETYQPLDSHWTEWGGWIGYLATARVVNLQGGRMPVLEEHALERWTSESFGTFGPLMTPERSGPVPRLTVKSRNALPVRTIHSDTRAALHETEQDAPGLATAVVVRDSFMTAAGQFFAESFGRTVFVSSPNTVFYDLVDLEEPDIVIHELVERSLVNAPHEPSLYEFREVFGDLLMDDEQAREDQVTSRVMMRLHKPDEALAANDRTLARVDATARMLVQRSRILAALGRSADAMDALRRATELDPDDGPIWLFLAQALNLAGQKPEAAAAAARAAKLEPRLLGVQSIAIALATTAGDIDSAAALVASARITFPEDDLLKYSSSVVQLAKGDMVRAETEIRDALAGSPDNDTYSAQLATVLARRGDLRGARDVLATLAAKHPSNKAYALHLAGLDARLNAASRGDWGE